MEYCLFMSLITLLATGGLGQAANVYMVLGNENLMISEHSLVNYHDLGESEETGLRCVTERMDCCSGDNGTRAEWFDPSNTNAGGGAFLRSRNGVGSAKGYVNLFQRINEQSNHARQGIYHCNIPAPSPSDDIRTLYVGIYKDNSDKGTPTVTSITYDQLSSEMFTLTCISTGGPAANVTWTLNGSVITYDVNHVLTQTVVNTATAEYNNTLTVTGREAGNYQCTVSNSRGNDTSQLLVNFTGTYIILQPSQVSLLVETFTQLSMMSMVPVISIPTTPVPSSFSHLPVAIAGAAVGLILIITLLVVLLSALIVYKRRKGTWPLRKHQYCLRQTNSSVNQQQMNPSTGQTLTAVANDTINNRKHSSTVNTSSSAHSHYYSTVKDSSDPLYSAITDTATPSADPLYSAVTELPIPMECIDPSYSLLTTDESDQTVQKEDKTLSTRDSYFTKQENKQASESVTGDEPKTIPGPGDVYAVVDKSKKVKRSTQSEARDDPNTEETGGPAETNAVYAVVQKGLKKKDIPPPLAAPYKDEYI